MIFAVETEQRSLLVFESEADAIKNCEALDVEAATWLFWNEEGEPLEPHFLKPNKRGLFIVQNGVYELRAASPDHHAALDEALEEVLVFEAPPPFNTPAACRNHFAARRAKRVSPNPSFKRTPDGAA